MRPGGVAVMDAAERQLLLDELEEERGPATEAWLQRVRELLDGRPSQAPLEELAQAAAEAGDWRRAGLLWRQCLRPQPPDPRTVVRTPGWW